MTLIVVDHRDPPRDPSKGWLQMLEEAERVKLWKDCTIEEKIERWEQVARVLSGLSPHQQDKHFDMTTWGDKTHCGTVACAAGHAGMDPWFEGEGFWMTLIPGKIRKNSWHVRFSVEPDEFFGETGHWAIFLSNGSAREVIRRIRTYVKHLRVKGDVPWLGWWGEPE